MLRSILKVLIRWVLSSGMLHNPWILRGLSVKRPNGEGRSGTHDQQQRGYREFPHGRNVARDWGGRKYRKSLDQEK